MTHRFPIKEIAQQAGLSTATVDRVLHERVNVAQGTALRVQAAIAELEVQENQIAARGRRMFVDIVVEAPARFSAQIRQATLDVLPKFGPAVIRPRFHFAELMDLAQLATILKKLAKLGSQGVCLKARNVAHVSQAIAELASAKIPTVTLATDVPDSPRLAYVGLDNLAAGETAAYLIGQHLGAGPSTVLTCTSQTAFLGEGERKVAFENSLPNTTRVIEVSGGAGLAGLTEAEVARTLQNAPAIDAVYSMGGGNAAILKVLDTLGQKPKVFVAHDVDQDNARLLRQHRLNYVLHHDLRLDMELAFSHIAAFHRLRLPVQKDGPSDVQVITPFNIPK